MCYRHDVVVYDPEDDNWLPIGGFPGYHVSESGHITHGDVMITPHVYNSYGHSQVRLYRGGKTHALATHRVVAEAFIPNPNGYPIVRHLDGDPTNNCADNLAWGTHKDNTRDSIEAGTFVYHPHQFTVEELARSIETNRTPVKAIDVTTGEELEFRSQADAARTLGVRQGNIGRVLRGLRNKTGGYTFEYINKEGD